MIEENEQIKIEYLNVTRLIKLFIAGSRWMSKYADVLNDLNVYPVPDGDTGTNMSMTMQSVENELVKLNYEPTMNEFCKYISEVILLGARGNSGTILSQIIQGLLSGFQRKEKLNIDDITKSFELSYKMAYRAVSNPVEGTMLTVIRVISEKAKIYSGPKDDLILYLSYIKEVAHEAVEDTPNQLVNLKEAGVVDAGGKGIFYLIEGFEKSITDPEMLKDLDRIVKSQASRREKFGVPHYMSDIKFKYCTEFIIQNGTVQLEHLKKEMTEHGDSVVVTQSSTKTKTHLHTNDPGIILNIALQYGNLDDIKIENMELQYRNLHLKEEDLPNKNSSHVMIQNENSDKKAYFAIADTYEIGELFIEAGATCVLVSLRGHNPRVADIEMAIAKIESNEIILLPNNKNIITTAKIVAERAFKNVEVFETRTMLDGHYYIKNRTENLEILAKDVRRNISIEIKKAEKNSISGDLKINKDEYIALINGKIMYKHKNIVTLIGDIYRENLNENALSVFTVLGKNSTEEGNIAVKNVGEIRYRECIGMQEGYCYYIYIENRDPDQSEIAIVTDSTSDLTQSLIDNLEISVIPLKIKFQGNQYYRDGIDISKKEFWNKIITEGLIPTTSQPSPAEFKKLYERLLKRGYKKIITILISSKLSGTLQSAKVARGMLEEEKDIAIIDSKNVWLGTGHLVLEAAKMSKAKESFPKIIETVEEMRDKSKIYFVVDELKYLERGGRIGKASSMIGEILNVKPILKIENGEVYSEKRAIGDSSAMRYMSKLIKQEAKNGSIILYTGWGGTKHQSENADEIKKSVEKQNQIDYKGRYEVGATIGAHSGPLFGIAIYPKIK